VVVDPCSALIHHPIALEAVKFMEFSWTVGFGDGSSQRSLDIKRDRQEMSISIGNSPETPQD